MPEHQLHWTALPRAASTTHVELDVFVSPRLGVDATQAEYPLSDFPELVDWPARVGSADVAFGISFDGGPPTPAQVVTPEPPDSALWTHLLPPTTPVTPWSFRDQSTRPIYSFPVRWTVAYLRDLYREVGHGSPTALPAVEDLSRLQGDLGGVIDTRVPEERDNARPEERAPEPEDTTPMGCLTSLIHPWCRLLRRLWRWLLALFGIGTTGDDPVEPVARPVPSAQRWVSRRPAPRPVDPVAAVEQEVVANGVMPTVVPAAPDMATALATYPVEQAWAQLRRFYERPESAPAPAAHPDAAAVPPPPAPPRWDVHRRLGALGDYPRLLQRMRLVIRLRVPRPAGNEGTVRVVPTWSGSTRPAVDLTPATAWRLDGDHFHAAPRAGSDLAGGMLDLHGTTDRLARTDLPYDLVQTDADGAAFKAMLAAASIERRWQLMLAELFGVQPPEPESVPATQTAGIALVRADRAFHLKQRLLRTRDLWQSAGGLALHADDVVRGYHVWIQQVGDPKWRSICARESVYRLVDDAGQLVDTRELTDDPGYVKRSGATSKDQSSPLYVHEAVLRWTGWSLVAPRPGRTIAPEPGKRYEPRWEVDVPTQHEKPRALASQVASQDGLRLETRFRPPANSLPRLRFGERYRLALTWVDLAGLPSAVLAGGPQALGEDARVSEEVRFRRFEPLLPPALLAARPFNAGESLERMVIRSDVCHDAATWHADVPAVADWLIADERRLFAPKTSQLLAELHGCFDDAIGPGGDRAKGFNRAVREAGTFAEPAITPFGIPGPAGGPVINQDLAAVLPTPYLPDPLVAGAVLRGVPGLTAAGVTGDPLTVKLLPGEDRPVIHVPFSGTWPDVESFRLRITDEDAGSAPHWDATRRVLTVRVPKGRVADIEYACYLAPEDLELLGIWDWLRGGPDMRAQAEAGLHWMISPSRRLTVVHAVQRPLAEPDLHDLAASKAALGATAANLAGSFKVDAPSTGRLDLDSNWSEPVDDPAAPKWVTESHEATVGNWNPEAADAPLPPLLHEFGDPRHRRVRYRLRASSRFREYLPGGLATERSGPEVEISIPASSPPDPPRVRYGVPTFTWDDSGIPAGPLGVGATARRIRRGGGIRLFLERPWFSSGEDELLAVVLPGPDPLPPNVVSRVGTDPTVAEHAVPATVALTPAMFPSAITAGAALLSERPATAAIASFEPRYDQQRGIWACDIGVDMVQLPWGDWPFLRLAVARHQREAIAGAELSTVVLAPWTQLPPDRDLRVTRTAADRITVDLRGHGRLAPSPNRMLVAFQRATSAAPDELEWTSAGDPTDGLPGLHHWQLAINPLPGGSERTWMASDVPVPSVGTDSLRVTVREIERRNGEGEMGRGVFRYVYADDVRLA